MKHNLLLNLSLAGLLLFLAGCSSIQPLPAVQRESMGTRHVLERNYELNRRETAFVGKAIIRVNDSQVETYRERRRNMKATSDFVLKGGPVLLSGKKETDYPVRARARVNRISYNVVVIPGDTDPSYSILVDQEGRPSSMVYSGNKFVPFNIEHEPKDLRFIPAEEGYLQSKILSGKIFELIYGGTDGKTIHITYREYSGEDQSKPVFFQDLVYGAKAGTIRFRDFLLKIHEADNEKIGYTVLEDGTTP
jgi:hypothetical protein